MRSSLLSVCESYIENYNIVKSVFSWDSTYIYPACAAVFTDKRQSANSDTLKYIRQLLKEQTSALSNFRSAAKTAVISKLAVSGKAEQLLEDALSVYSMLRKKFHASAFLPLTAMVIAESSTPDRFDMLSDETRRIYEMMKKFHPLLTGGEDSVYAAMLAVSAKPHDKIAADISVCYKMLKGEFFSANAVQSLSHILALSDKSAVENCEKTLLLYRTLKERGYKYGTNYELATIGTLALIPVDNIDALVNDICEVDGFLSDKKGYGFFGFGKKQRLMHAGMLVEIDRLSDKNIFSSGYALACSSICLIAAQQAAMCAAIASSAAASAGASSGGN